MSAERNDRPISSQSQKSLASTADASSYESDLDSDVAQRMQEQMHVEVVHGQAQQGVQAHPSQPDADDYDDEGKAPEELVDRYENNLAPAGANVPQDPIILPGTFLSLLLSISYFFICSYPHFISIFTFFSDFCFISIGVPVHQPIGPEPAEQENGQGHDHEGHPMHQHTTATSATTTCGSCWPYVNVLRYIAGHISCQFGITQPWIFTSSGFQQHVTI